MTIEDPRGERGLSPEDPRTLLGSWARIALESAPEELRAAVAEALVRELDTLETKIGPAQAGETILFGEANLEVLRGEVRKALDQVQSERT